jgi:25S rRNA (adenine2142-N1)-methyltransferase
MNEERKDRQLADIIKSTHANLRKRALEKSDTEAWSDHVEELFKSKSTKYSQAMKTLSEDFWENETRLNWISKYLTKYFVEKDVERFQKRLCRRAHISDEKSILDVVQNFEKPIRILDVGACHNPLSKILDNSDIFEITAIDLSPASESVFRADFLQIPLSDKEEMKDKNELKELKKSNYDAVIFCLLLEYLPTPKLRLKAVEKALQVLKPFGLLLLVTPDSSHQGKNLDQMRSWRLAMAELGFLRIYTEKLKHVTCLGFVKISPMNNFESVFNKDIQMLRDKMTDIPTLESLFFIPQDKN